MTFDRLLIHSLGLDSVRATVQLEGLNILNTLNFCFCLVTYEKVFITKECIITCVHLHFIALHFSTNQHLAVVKKLFQATINATTLRASFLLNTSPLV